MTEARSLHFYFDYLSHNAYLAWTQLPGLAARHGLQVHPIPVLFAALLEAHGQLGPAEVPAKRKWMGRNVMRKAAILAIPLEPPRHHPFNPLLALRVSSLPLSEDQRRRVIDRLFLAVWRDRLHVADPDVVVHLLDEIGLEGRALVERAVTSETKERLRDQTREAIEAGVFGVPTMVVGNELFFGFDDFPYLERVLAGNDPLSPETLEKWAKADIQPSAVRRPFRDPPSDP